MKTPRRQSRSPYMEWAKLRTHARFDLAASGVGSLPLADLPVEPEEMLAALEITGAPGYGYPPLIERLAGRAGVGTESVVRATGTSMANHLALAANGALVDRFLDTRADLVAVRAEHGTIVFPRLANGSVERLCGVIQERYDTSVVPGRFFEEPEHFRLGIGAETAVVEEGLRRLGLALDELAGGPSPRSV